MKNQERRGTDPHVEVSDTRTFYLQFNYKDYGGIKTKERKQTNYQRTGRTGRGNTNNAGYPCSEIWKGWKTTEDKLPG